MDAAPGTSAWSRLADLELVVERCETRHLEADAGAFGRRVTTEIVLHGEGEEGVGEEVGGPGPEPHEALRRLVPDLPLAGRYTLAAFCDHAAALEVWPEPPEWELMRSFRRYAFESAALDLALRQAGLPLHEALGREPRPLRFVNSLGLGEQPDVQTVLGRVAAYPDLRFKLDAHPAWTLQIVDALVETHAVDVIDFKGCYGLEVKDEPALLRLYERLLPAFPDALVEDPHPLEPVTALLAGHERHVSYDAPIRSTADLATTPIRVRTINVKPTRIGSLRTLLELYAHCEAHGIAMYGGGMGELGVGRGQIQLLAALHHPDGSNDVAPSAYNAPALAAGLATSPLDPRPAPTGFRRAPEPS
jgi:L-alanine-DL-glutamate epimerase-like enolase superfamily enzyme